MFKDLLRYYISVLFRQQTVERFLFVASRNYFRTLVELFEFERNVLSLSRTSRITIWRTFPFSVD